MLTSNVKQRRSTIGFPTIYFYKLCEDVTLGEVEEVNSIQKKRKSIEDVN